MPRLAAGRERRVHDGARSAATEALSPFSREMRGSLPRGSRGARAPLYSRLAEGSGGLEGAVPLLPSSHPDKAHRRVSTALCPPKSISSGTTSATSSGATRPTSSSTSGSSRSSSPRSTARPSTCGRPSTSGPRSRSATCPCCGAPPRAASTPMRSSRWSGPTGRRPATSDAPRAHAPGDARERLNPKYSFEQFVIGEGNRFAHAASLAVAELPAQAYNPLFLHGPPGLGKTHLLHAIGNYVQRYGSGLRVRYATIEEFTTRVRRRRPPPPHRRLQGRLPQRRRGPDRRRPVPRRPHQDARGVLPHLQRAARLRSPARAHLRPQPRGAAGPRGPPVGALPGRAGRRARAAAGRAAPGDPRQARPPRRRRGVDRRAGGDRARGSTAACGRSRAR